MFKFLKIFLFFLLFLKVEAVFSQRDITERFYTEEEKQEEAVKLSREIPFDTIFERNIPFEIESYKNNPDFSYVEVEKSGIMSKILHFLSKMIQSLFGQEIDLTTEKVLNFLYFVIFLAVTFLAIKLILTYKGRWFLEKDNQILEVSIEEAEKNIHQTDFRKLLQFTENKGDTRQSIRLYYLWLLKVLSSKKIISWDKQKTNADYIYEIKDEKMKQDFKELSRLYNYIWYGEFSIEDTEYKEVKSSFEAIINA